LGGTHCGNMQSLSVSLLHPRYRESLFPHPIFKTVEEFLDSFVDDRKACPLYVRIFYRAVKQGKEKIITVLEEMLAKKKMISISEIEQTVGYIPKKEEVTQGPFNRKVRQILRIANKKSQKTWTLETKWLRGGGGNKDSLYLGCNKLTERDCMLPQ